MASLPTPGGDIGVWAPKLDSWLLVGHNSDGTLNTASSAALIALRDFACRIQGLPIINVLDKGAIPDGEVNPATGALIGTDNTAAFQAADTAAKALGGGIIFVPSAGVSQFVNPRDGSPLGKGWRIDGTFTISPGNFALGTEGWNVAGQNTGHTYMLSAGINLIPPSSLPTILCSNAVNETIHLSSGAGMRNFAFLWPGQTSFDTSAGGNSVAVYPPGVRTDTSSVDMVFENIVDYNSYILVEWNGGNHGRVQNIVSQSLQSIIDSHVHGLNECVIDNIQYGQGIIYQGGNAMGPGPLINLLGNGPFHISRLSMNGCSGSALKVLTNWGFRLTNSWIDQCGLGGTDFPVDIEQNAAGSGQAAYLFIDSVEITPGCTNALRLSFPNGNLAAGSNNCFALISNSELAPLCSYEGEMNVQESNVFHTKFVKLKGGVHSFGLRHISTGCTYRDGRFFANGGTVWVQASNYSSGQNTFLNDDYTSAGATGTMYVKDLDRRKTVRVTVPAGTVLSAGRTVIDHIYVDKNFGAVQSDSQMLVHEAMGNAAQNDYWTIKSMAAADEKTLFTAADQIGVTGIYAGGQRSVTGSADFIEGLVAPVYQFVVGNNGFARGFEISYHAAGGVTVPAGGYVCDITYGWG